MTRIKKDDAVGQARLVLHSALLQIKHDDCMPTLEAIEALIDAKVTAAIEAIADRIQDASGVRP